MTAELGYGMDPGPFAGITCAYSVNRGALCGSKEFDSKFTRFTNVRALVT